jgi:hypothetical protein
VNHIIREFDYIREQYSITGGNHEPETIIWLEGTKLFSEMWEYICFQIREEHLVRNKKVQWSNKGKDGYRAESESHM